jgi:hypothetical protein
MKCHLPFLTRLTKPKPFEFAQTTLRCYLSSGVREAIRVVLVIATLIVIGVLAWQGATAAGNPDPTAPQISPSVAILDIGVLVFREGLECILVLSAIIASMGYGAIVGIVSRWGFRSCSFFAFRFDPHTPMAKCQPAELRNLLAFLLSQK